MSTSKQTTQATDAVIKDTPPNDVQKLTDAINAGVAAKAAAHQAAAQIPPVPAPAEKSMWASVKGFFTSPTMCTFGMLGASMLAGAVGGIAATEARSRGYLGGPGPVHTPMLPPPNNG